MEPLLQPEQHDPTIDIVNEQQGNQQHNHIDALVEVKDQNIVQEENNNSNNSDDEINNSNQSIQSAPSVLISEPIPLTVNNTTIEKLSSENQLKLSSGDELSPSTSPKISISKFIESNIHQSKSAGRQRSFTIGGSRTYTKEILDNNNNNNNTNNSNSNDLNDNNNNLDSTDNTNNNNNNETNQPIKSIDNVKTTAFLSTSPNASTSPQSNHLLNNHRSSNFDKQKPLVRKAHPRLQNRQQKQQQQQMEAEQEERERETYRIQQQQRQPVVNNIQRDIHGFVVDNYFEELKKFEREEALKTQNRIENWTNYNTQYRQSGLCSNPKQLRKLLSLGIPHEIRSPLWKLYSGAVEKQRKEEIELFKIQKEEKLKTRLTGLGTIRGLNPPSHRKSYYQHLHHIIKTSNRYSTRLQSMPEIDKDIERTFPGHPFFESDEGKRKLTRVLQAYSIRNRKVGYCQSMNIVAGYLLYVVNRNEEDAFWLLSTIVEDYCHNYYSTNLLGSQVDMAVFDELAKTHLPSLYTHLQNYSVSLTLLSTKWFMCLYIGVLPNETVFRIWDHLFVECGIYGYHKPQTESLWLEGINTTYKCQGLGSYNLLMIGLAILSTLEDSLMKTQSTPLLLDILSNHVKGIFPAKHFFKRFNRWRDKIDENSFNTLKQKQEVNLIRELEDMRKARDLRTTIKVTRFSKGELEKIWTGFRNLGLVTDSKSRASMGKSLKLDFQIFKKVFIYILPNMMDAPAKEVIIQQLFKSFDKNKDGCLDFSELMSGLCILAKGTSEERLKLYFSFFDSDNSGFVTKEEMKLMLNTVYDKIDMDPLAVTQYTIEEYVDIVFSNLGITNDHLSFEDFRQAILSYPRIFKCFMIEEETFTIEDFEIQDENNNNQSTPSTVTTTTTNTINVDNNNVDNQQQQQQHTNQDNSNDQNIHNNQNNTPQSVENNVEELPTKKSSSTLNFTTNKPTSPSEVIIKTSTFKSSLLEAIEQAQKENNTATTGTGTNDSSKQPNGDHHHTKETTPSNDIQPEKEDLSAQQKDKVNTSGKSNRSVQPDMGPPLSCCKFM